MIIVKYAMVEALHIHARVFMGRCGNWYRSVPMLVECYPYMEDLKELDQRKVVARQAMRFPAS